MESWSQKSSVAKTTNWRLPYLRTLRGAGIEAPCQDRLGISPDLQSTGDDGEISISQ